MKARVRQGLRRITGTAPHEALARPRPGVTIELEHPVTPLPRYGWGRPTHPQLDALVAAGRARYEQTLDAFCEFADDLGRVPVDELAASEPFWNNDWFQGLDIVALYAFLAHRDPRTYLEIGSGYSTRVARRAIRDHGLRTRLLAIDPEPRSSVAALVDDHVPSRLEQAELGVLATLEAGDIVLFDGSHRALMNSDATVFFTEVLPRIPPGVLVQVHDVFLPWDYRPDWSHRWYSEQYLLACWLLGGPRVEVVMPSFYVYHQRELHDRLTPIWARHEPAQRLNLADPTAFWFEVHGDPGRQE